MSRVTLTNPFALLPDENDDPAPKKEQQKPAAQAAKPAVKPASQAAKPAAKPAAPKAEAAKAPAKPAENKGAAKQTANNNSGGNAKQAPIRDSNQNLQEHNKETRPPRDRRDRPPHPAGDRKRPFDRKSGTGRPQNEVKRHGQGKGNWGGVDAKEGSEAFKEKDEKVDEREEAEEKPAGEGEKKEEEATKEGEAAAAPAKEEDKEITYEEYLAKQKSKALPKVDALKPRTVVAEDLSAAGLVALERDDSKEKKEKKAAVAPATGEKKDKKDLAAELLQFHFARPDQKRDRPFRKFDDNKGERRGPRNGPRPPRNDAPKQQGAPSQPPVQEKDFPALGPHGSDPVKA